MSKDREYLVALYGDIRAAHRILGLDDDWPLQLDELCDKIGKYLYPCQDQGKGVLMEPTWAIVELMGHVRVAGRLSEEEKFGSKLGRLDIPQLRKSDCVNCTDSSVSLAPCPVCRGGTFVTQYFGGGSVYRISIVSEDVARHVASQTQPAPVSPWDFPKRLASPVDSESSVSGSCMKHPDEDDDFSYR